MTQDLERVATPPGHSATPEPASGLGPSGECPSRDRREAHMDSLVERAIKAEMQRDELLRGLRAIIRKHERMTAKIGEPEDDRFVEGYLEGLAQCANAAEDIIASATEAEGGDPKGLRAEHEGAAREAGTP